MNGNLVGDGANTYTWNARDQLIGISGAQSQTVTYDGEGRRQSSAVSGTSRALLYDGLNLVQELSGGSPSVSYLTGANVDETFNATTTSGSQNVMTDMVGSTMALTNSAGSIQTSYTYDPYGNVTSTGTTSTNKLQYTGRENDGTGLYYYRARYYSPKWGRFISEDPIGLAGGVNEYAYVRGNPVGYVDPLGLFLWDFNAGAHVLLPGGAAVGPNFNATYVPGQGFEGATSSMGWELELGALADIGANAGVSGLSSCQTGKKAAITVTLPIFGKYGGVTFNFIGAHFDGLDVAFGLGVNLPITGTLPLEW